MKHETTTFAQIPIGGTFEKQFDGRTLEYVKIDEYKARVKRDPFAKYVGCVYSIPTTAEVQMQAPLKHQHALALLKVAL